MTFNLSLAVRQSILLQAFDSRCPLSATNIIF